MRKAKLTGDVMSVMEVSHTSLGVQTRAKTLALQKLQASKTATAPPPEHDDELLYLQLRSHRLENPPPDFQSISYSSIRYVFLIDFLLGTIFYTVDFKIDFNTPSIRFLLSS